jgi:hypothetical protein
MAANPLRGEAELQAGDRTFKLVLDVNAFCCIQPVLNMKPRDILGTFEAEPDDMVVSRAILWGALQKHHDCHLVEAGEIMADAGLAETRVALTNCLAACFGAAEGKEQGNPPKAKRTRGTG